MRTGQQWKLTPIDPPGMPDMKAVYLYGKHRKFIPDSFHHLTCPKPDDDVLKKIKDHRRNIRNKRLEALKLDKDDTCFFVIGMQDESKKRCVDGNNINKDVVVADDSLDADCSDAEKERE